MKPSKKLGDSGYPKAVRAELSWRTVEGNTNMYVDFRPGLPGPSKTGRNGLEKGGRVPWNCPDGAGSPRRCRGSP